MGQRIAQGAGRGTLSLIGAEKPGFTKINLLAAMVVLE